MSEAGDTALTQEQIRGLLIELGADLDARGLRAELFVVGGAAMALAYNTRRATRDVDAVFEPKSEIGAAAGRLGAKYDLPESWLNDAVKGFLPGEDPHQRVVLSAPGINVSVPSPEYLLALKVAAARVDWDADDIRTLAGMCGAETSEAVLAIVERIMGRRLLLPEVQFQPANPRQMYGKRVTWWCRSRALRARP